jgi:hypothetical protein
MIVIKYILINNTIFIKLILLKIYILEYLSNVLNMEFDKFLGAYPLENYGNFKDLSNYID